MKLKQLTLWQKHNLMHMNLEWQLLGSTFLFNTINRSKLLESRVKLVSIFGGGGACGPLHTKSPKFYTSLDKYI